VGSAQDSHITKRGQVVPLREDLLIVCCRAVDKRFPRSLTSLLWAGMLRWSSAPSAAGLR
jgi:hypothetical protein